MAKRTKAELIQIRETTYKPPETPERRCETCGHSWGMFPVGGMIQCHVVMKRIGKQVEVHSLGICDLFEAKEASDGK